MRACYPAMQEIHGKTGMLAKSIRHSASSLCRMLQTPIMIRYYLHENPRHLMRHKILIKQIKQKSRFSFGRYRNIESEYS
jgi:hypothetical protein